MTARRLNVPGLARLPAFSHAVVTGDLIFISGMLGTRGDEVVLVEGGVTAQTRLALQNILTVLAACGATTADLAKVTVYLADISDFSAMNEVYLAVIGADPPARITVGGVKLALGAAVEIDSIASLPADSPLRGD